MEGDERNTAQYFKFGDISRWGLSLFATMFIYFYIYKHAHVFFINVNM